MADLRVTPILLYIEAPPYLWRFDAAVAPISHLPLLCTAGPRGLFVYPSLARLFHTPLLSSSDLYTRSHPRRNGLVVTAENLCIGIVRCISDPIRNIMPTRKQKAPKPLPRPVVTILRLVRHVDKAAFTEIPLFAAHGNFQRHIVDLVVAVHADNTLDAVENDCMSAFLALQHAILTSLRNEPGKAAGQPRRIKQDYRRSLCHGHVRIP